MHDLIKTLRLKCAPYSMAEFIEKLDTKNYVCIEGLVKKHKEGGGGWTGAFGNVVDKKHMTHPLP